MAYRPTNTIDFVLIKTTEVFRFKTTLLTCASNDFSAVRRNSLTPSPYILASLKVSLGMLTYSHI